MTLAAVIALVVSINGQITLQPGLLIGPGNQFKCEDVTRELQWKLEGDHLMIWCQGNQGT